ncbi:hypothetical protein IV505_05935 [Pseudomonas fulva]|nr:hypothetical protein [Pseudomonas fulva]MBF8779279.1 hypothetical protein [Pseudomonas fulva]
MPTHSKACANLAKPNEYGTQDNFAKRHCQKSGKRWGEKRQAAGGQRQEKAARAGGFEPQAASRTRGVRMRHHLLELATREPAAVRLLFAGR